MNDRSMSVPAPSAPYGRPGARRSIVPILLASILCGPIGAPLAAGAATATPNTPAPSLQAELDASPHAEALALVLRTQQAAIRMAEAHRAKQWNVDTLEREFRVKRPIGPGDNDSTRWFNVTYLIEGREVASWFVDTRIKSVTRHPLEPAQ